MKQIIIMRHGQPQIDLESLKNRKLSSSCLGDLVGQYQRSPLCINEGPTTDAIRIANQSDVLLTSDLPRSIESANKLIKGQRLVSDEDFRESSLPYLNLNHPKLSFFSWAITYRILWFLGFSKNGESIKHARRRAKSCANKLINLADCNGSVLLLGHGMMNRLISKELVSCGWFKSKSTGEKYWSYTVFQRAV